MSRATRTPEARSASALRWPAARAAFGGRPPVKGAEATTPSLLRRSGGPGPSTPPPPCPPAVHLQPPAPPSTSDRSPLPAQAPACPRRTPASAASWDGLGRFASGGRLGVAVCVTAREPAADRDQLQPLGRGRSPSRGLHAGAGPRGEREPGADMRGRPEEEGRGVDGPGPPGARNERKGWLPRPSSAGRTRPQRPGSRQRKGPHTRRCGALAKGLLLTWRPLRW